MKCYRNIKGIGFIWNGAYSDPELYYRGKYFNYWDIEDAFYTKALEDFGREDISAAEFNQWFLDNEDVCRGYLDDVWEISPFDWKTSREAIA